MDKIIKSFEEYVRNFKPCCTSDDVDLDMLKCVLAIVKGVVKPPTKLERLNDAFNEYEEHMKHLPEAVIVTDGVLQSITDEVCKLYTRPPSYVNPRFRGVYVKTVNDHEVALITSGGSVIKYSLDEGREIE